MYTHTGKELFLYLQKVQQNDVMYVHAFMQQQQRVAVGPGNNQFMSIRQVSLRRAAAAAANAAAAACAAVMRQCVDSWLIITN